MNTSISLFRVLAALCALTLPCLATSYTVQVLDTPSGPLFANAINDKSQIVGSYNPGDGPSRGFLLDHGVLTTIDPPGTPPDAEVSLSGINNSGVIVGAVEIGVVPMSTDYAFVDDGGKFTFYGPMSGLLATDFVSINNKGQILGGSSICDCSFIYEKGTVTPLSLPGSFTSAYDLDDTGQIVGYYIAGSHEHGYLYGNGAYTTVDSPVSANTTLVAINNVGQMIGQADGYGPGGSLSSFLDDHGTFTVVSPSPKIQFLAADINDLGQVVGSAYYPSGPADVLLTPVPAPEPVPVLLLPIAGTLLALTLRWRHLHSRNEGQSTLIVS